MLSLSGDPQSPASLEENDDHFQVLNPLPNASLNPHMTTDLAGRTMNATRKCCRGSLLLRVHFTTLSQNLECKKLSRTTTEKRKEVHHGGSCSTMPPQIKYFSDCAVYSHSWVGWFSVALQSQCGCWTTRCIICVSEESQREKHVFTNIISFYQKKQRISHKLYVTENRACIFSFYI